MIRPFEDATEGITHKGRAPEFQTLLQRRGEGERGRRGDKNRLMFPPLALSPLRPLAFTALTLISDSVHGRHIDAVGQGMRTLNQFPGFLLSCSELGLFTRMPADGRGIKENVRALESGEPGGFRIPLIPANEHTDSAETSVECSEA